MCFRVFSFSSDLDTTRYGKEFLSDVNGKIKYIFSNHSYVRPTEKQKKERRAKTLVKAAKAQEIKDFVEDRNKDIKGNWHSLDRLYRRAKEASLAIKKIGGNTDTSNSRNIPNLLFFLRAYDREKPRAARVIEKEHIFSVVMPIMSLF